MLFPYLQNTKQTKVTLSKMKWKKIRIKMSAIGDDWMCMCERVFVIVCACSCEREIEERREMSTKFCDPLQIQITLTTK